MTEVETQTLIDDLLGYVQRMTHNQPLAEDVVQDAMMKVISKDIISKDLDQLRAYTFRTAYNLVIDNYRANNIYSNFHHIDDTVIQQLSADSAEDIALVEVAAEEAKACYADLKKELTWQDAQALELVVFGGLSLNHAAASIGIKNSAMKVRIHRARKRMKVLLERECEISESKEKTVSCIKKKSSKLPC